MKKTYIKPSVEIVNIGTQQMIAASGDGLFFDSSENTGWGNLNDEFAGDGPAMSRGGSIWDD